MTMDLHELSAIVGKQIDAATGSVNSEINHQRSDLYERYMGEPYGDEVEDRSSVVMSDISDTIEWLMPDLMEIFTAGDRTVEFEPQGPEDERGADQETDVLNYVIDRKNKGFYVLYQWFKDALIAKNGIVKRYWDERQVIEVEEYEEMTPDELARTVAQIELDGGEYEVLEQSGGVDEETGHFEPFHVKLRITRTLKEPRVVNVPPEEFILSPRHNSIYLDNVAFCAHRQTLTVTDLIEMGFDPDQVMALPDQDDEYEEEKYERFNAKHAYEALDAEEPDETMREVAIYECYIRADYDGDGKAELLQVYVGGEGNEVLNWADGGPAVEQVDAVPFSALTPVILSHKFYGRSIAEIVEDLQRIRTVLVRQMLDNVYLTNNADKIVGEDAASENTLSDLLVSRPGRIVRANTVDAVRYEQPPQIVPQALAAIEFVDTLRENRTGVTKYNQGLDANSLNKTASGVSQIMNAAQKKVALIARIFAETGVTDLFLGLHRMMRKGPMKKITLRLRNEWVEVDPQTWKERADMRVTVGLGTGNKDQQIQRLFAILEQQKEGKAAGLAWVQDKHLYHTLSKLVEAAGFPSVDPFFDDPEHPSGPPPQPQADPMQGVLMIEKMKIDAQMQADMAKLQADAQKAALEMQSKMLLARMEDDRKRDEVNVRAATDLAKVGLSERAATFREMNKPPQGAGE